MPGNKITLVGIYCIKRNIPASKHKTSKAHIGIRHPYVRALGIRIDPDSVGRSSAQILITAEEEEEFIRFAHMPNVYEMISNSIAPSIFGAHDIKKAVTCLLFGGSRKRLIGLRRLTRCF